jgi:hypothetical protein
LRAASARSPSLTMLYRSNTARVLCPLSFIATRSGTPALTRLRTAVLRKSWRILPLPGSRDVVHFVVAICGVA